MVVAEERDGSASSGEGTASAIKSKFTRRQWLTIVAFGLTNFMMGATYSLQGPFYPQEAEKKGSTPSEYGFVFGVFELTALITSPIYGKYMNNIGPLFCFYGGILLNGLSLLLFGFLDKVESHDMFLGLSIGLRILEAVGAIAVVCALFTMIAIEFPDSVGTTFASLETFFGLGLIAGPTIGGGLFELGGFLLPFLVGGALIFITSFLAWMCLPKVETATDADGNRQEGIGVFQILKVPSVFLCAATIFMCSASSGFLTATLEPHLRPFELSPVEIGLTFMLIGGLYGITAPFWGYVCDRIKQPKLIALAGSVFVMIGFVFIGPLPFVPLDGILWVICVGLVFFGTGLGCCNVAGFVVALKDSVKHGFPDNLATYAAASALWSSALSAGQAIGPSIAGILFDSIGFRNGTLFIFFGELIIGIFVLIFIILEARAMRRAEKQPLLGESNIEDTSQRNSSQSQYGSV